MWHATFSGNANVGAPPTRRNVASNAAITDGIVRSRNGTTTRNRDHANQATNNTTRAPPSEAAWV